jgi:hypothetical protein
MDGISSPRESEEATGLSGGNIISLTTMLRRRRCCGAAGPPRYAPGAWREPPALRGRQAAVARRRATLRPAPAAGAIRTEGRVSS